MGSDTFAEKLVPPNARKSAAESNQAKHRLYTDRAAADAGRPVEAIAAAGASAKFLAGRTTLYDLMKLGVGRPVALVDVSRLAELTTIVTSSGDHLVFGGGARMSDVAVDPVVRRDYPVLSESLWRASQQLRNMATVAGNLLTDGLMAFRRAEPHRCWPPSSATRVPCTGPRPSRWTGCSTRTASRRGRLCAAGRVRPRRRRRWGDQEGACRCGVALPIGRPPGSRLRHCSQPWLAARCFQLG